MKKNPVAFGCLLAIAIVMLMTPWRKSAYGPDLPHGVVVTLPLSLMGPTCIENKGTKPLVVMPAIGQKINGTWFVMVPGHRSVIVLSENGAYRSKRWIKTPKCQW